MAEIRLDGGDAAGLEHGRGPAAAWARATIDRVAERLAADGHRVRRGEDPADANPAVYVALAARAGARPQFATFIADEGDEESLDLAAALQETLAGAGDEPAADPRLARWLEPRRLAGARAAVVVLTGVTDPRPDGDDALAARLADAVLLHLRARGVRRRVSARREFDIWHEVPLVPQVTGMSCWAACAAMIVGWRDQLWVDPRDIARGVGRWHAYRDGLQPRDVDALASVWGLRLEPPRRYEVPDLERLLTRHGPLWFGQADPDLHVIALVGLHGDGEPDTTWARINDPWPPGEGERYSITLRELSRNFRSAGDLVGAHVQVLHAGGRADGSGTRVSERRSVRLERSWTA